MTISDVDLFATIIFNKSGTAQVGTTRKAKSIWRENLGCLEEF